MGLSHNKDVEQFLNGENKRDELIYDVFDGLKSDKSKNAILLIQKNDSDSDVWISWDLIESGIVSVKKLSDGRIIAGFPTWFYEGLYGVN